MFSTYSVDTPAWSCHVKRRHTHSQWQRTICIQLMRSNATWLIRMCRDSPWVHAHTMGESRHEWHMDGTLHSLSQHAATHGNTLQHTVTHGNTRQHTATHCNTLQHPATHGNTLQHTATHCNILHCTATHSAWPAAAHYSVSCSMTHSYATK